MPVQLKLEKRTRKGSRESRRLRRDGYIPGVIYGRKDAEEIVKINRHHFMTEIGFARSLGIVELDLEGTTLKSILKDVQWDSLTDKPVHIDFMTVSDDQMVTVPVPVRLEGSPLGVSIDGGILDHTMYEVDITVKASDIPPELVFDVSNLRLNERLHLSSIELPEGMSADLTNDPVIASIIPPKVSKSVSEEEEAEGEEAEEGAEQASEDEDS